MNSIVYQNNRTIGTRWLIWLALLVCSIGSSLVQAAAPPEDALLGIWQGELVINPSTHLTIQFIVSRDGQGKPTAVLNAPNEPNLQNIPVTTFGLASDRVTFVVDEVNGSYEGTLKDRKMDGKWKQSGASFDLALAPYTIEKIAGEVAARLEGAWHGTLNVPNTDIKVPLVINFKADPASESGVSATVDSPNQAAFGIPAEDVSMQDGTISVSVLRPKMAFNGKLEGNELVGRWIQGGSAPLTFNKGQYQAAGLDVDKAARKRLVGNWYGELSNGLGIAFRFKEDSSGKFAAFLDSPHEGRKGIPLDRITIEGDTLSLNAGAIRMVFDGTLAQETITGKLSANGPAREVILKRGEYVPQTFHLAQDLAGKLTGRWEGKTANANMVLRFQVNERGDVLALQDLPNRQMWALPITDLSFDGENLRMTVKGISAEFKGRLVNNEMSGDWTMPSNEFPLTLLRTAMTAK